MIQLPTSIQEDKDAGKTYAVDFAECVTCGDFKAGDRGVVHSWAETHAAIHRVRALRVTLATTPRPRFQ